MHQQSPYRPKNKGGFIPLQLNVALGIQKGFSWLKKPLSASPGRTQTAHYT
jgi:hypothetical protein